MLGSLGDGLVHISAHYLLGTSTTAQYISQLIFPFKELTVFRFVVGFIAHLFTGGILGIGLMIIYNYFRSDYPYFKGVGLGIASWLLHVIVIPNMVAPRPFLFRNETEVVVDFIAHMVFSVIAVTYLVRIKRNQESVSPGTG